MPGIHPSILFIVIKNIVVFLAFYFGGASNNVLLWWMVGNALFYALAALNIALRTDQQREEEKLTQRIGPSWGD
jgi:hypothetical protein